MKLPKSLIILLIVNLFFNCENDSSGSKNQEDNTPNTPNILLIIADDMGLDATPGYSLGSTKPNMPNLQSLIDTGIRFNNVWSNPTCTPTRAGILTGKYGFRTNVTKVGDVLSTSETSIQKQLDLSNTGYNHAVIGKWHLSDNDAMHPTNMGINHYAGTLGGGVQSYWNWNFTENGQTSTSTEYTTTKFTDLAINWIGEQTQPWFLWLAYNAPHTPFHLPPNDLHYQGNLPTDQASIDANPLPYYMAMIEAMDTEIGRLIEVMSEEEKENTVIIFVGDNGSPNQVVQEYNNNRAKGSLYQGGVNVPMIISGKNIIRVNATEDVLINTTDLFATILDIADTGITDLHDSKSFKGLLTTTNTTKRDYIYTEIGQDSGISDYAIRNTTHKYIYFEDGSEAMYDLSDNPLERPNLLSVNQLPLSTSDSAIKDELVNQINTIKN